MAKNKNDSQFDYNFKQFASPKATVLWSSLITPSVFEENGVKWKPRFTIKIELTKEQADEMAAKHRPALVAAVTEANKTSATEIKAKDLPITKRKTKSPEGVFADTGTYTASFGNYASYMDGTMKDPVPVIYKDGTPCVEPFMGSTVCVLYTAQLYQVGADIGMKFVPIECVVYELKERPKVEREEIPE